MRQRIYALILPVLLGSAVAVAGDLLEVRAMDRVPVSEETQKPILPQFRSMVSERNLLDLRRTGKELLPLAALDADQTITIKMCAIRVQFQYEDPDDDATTGRGHFDFRTYDQFAAEERHAIDPAPHNREYFSKHIQALHNYWHTVSNGRVAIVGTVFPLQSDSVYTLDRPMSHYGAPSPYIGLAEFFNDAFVLADQDDDINWFDYDVYMIFHAGSDRQNDLGFPPTTHDLFTGFIIMQSPVWVVDEDDTIGLREGMIMPETVCQDNRVTALNAVMAHEFGHQLGLIDLYDTHRFNTFVGDFSLMDNNGFGTGVDLGFERSRAVLGTIPIYPDAWSRAYLGFADVIEVDSGTNIAVWAAELQGTRNRIYKIPISENEYFLIENRQDDFDEYPGANLKADLDTAGGNTPTGVILGPAPGQGWNPDVPAPVTREYDYLTPGAGLVIWHVDETVAWLDYDGNGINNFRDNALQWYYYAPLDTLYEPWENRPFVRLMEADGIIDFGGEYWTNYGRPQDYFSSSGNKHFGPHTNPSTLSNSGAYTGVDVSDISGIDTIMYFDLKQESRMIGWPHHSAGAQFPAALYDINGDELEEVFVSGKRYILGFRPNGDFIFPPPPGTAVISQRRSTPGTPRNEIVYYDTLRVIADVGLDASISTPPTVADLNGDGVAELAFGTDSGQFYLYQLTDDNADGRADSIGSLLLAPAAVTAEIVATDADPASAGLELVAGTADGGVHIIDVQGELLSRVIGFNHIEQFSISSDFAQAYVLNYVENGDEREYFIHDLNDPAKFTAIPGEVIGFSAGYIDTTAMVWLTAVTREGVLYAFQAGTDQFGGYFAGNPAHLEAPATSQPVLFPGRGEFGRCQVYFGGDNRLYGYNLNGSPVENFPRAVDMHRPAGFVTSAPLIVDLVGDSQPEYIIGTACGEIYILTSDGSRLLDSPLSAPSGIAVSLAFCPRSSAGAGRGVLYALTDDGLIYGFAVPVGDAGEDAYNQFGGGAHHRNFQERELSATADFNQLITYAYNYPNPSGDVTQIRFEITHNATIDISIYNLAGRLIFENSLPATGGMPNEYSWDLREVPSGVYPCRLEVRSDDRQAVKIWNIAVVK